MSTPTSVLVPTEAPATPSPERAALITVGSLPDLGPGRRAVELYLQRKTDNSRRALRRALDVIAATLSNGEADADGIPWHLVRYPHAAAALDRVEKRYAPATTRQALAALRGVLNACWQLELISAEELAKTIKPLKPPRGKRQVRPGRDLSPLEIRDLFLACRADPAPAGVRDAALLAVLYGGGLRRAESVALDVGDYHAETEQLRVRRGKGDKERITYVTGAGRQAILNWLALRGELAGPLFVPVYGAKIHLRRLTDQAVYAILQKRAAQAGVDAFSPHDLRRTFAGDLLDAQVDISTVKELMGHADINTTARYDRRGERAKQEGARRLRIPYGL